MAQLDLLIFCFIFFPLPHPPTNLCCHKRGLFLYEVKWTWMNGHMNPHGFQSLFCNRHLLCISLNKDILNFNLNLNLNDRRCAELCTLWDKEYGKQLHFKVQWWYQRRQSSYLKPSIDDKHVLETLAACSAHCFSIPQVLALWISTGFAVPAEMVTTKTEVQTGWFVHAADELFPWGY